MGCCSSELLCSQTSTDFTENSFFFRSFRLSAFPPNIFFFSLKYSVLLVLLFIKCGITTAA